MLSIWSYIMLDGDLSTSKKGDSLDFGGIRIHLSDILFVGSLGAGQRKGTETWASFLDVLDYALLELVISLLTQFSQWLWSIWMSCRNGKLPKVALGNS